MFRALILCVILAATSAACGGTSSVPPTAPALVVASPAPVVPTPLGVNARCGGPFHPGQSLPLACIISVTPSTAPDSTGIRLSADLTAFGRQESYFSMCPACGGPPTTFDMDLYIPFGMSPGLKTFPVWVTDDQGRRADTAGTVEIVGPPSQLRISTRCLLGPVHPGQDVACFVSVEDVNYPQEQFFYVWADLRIFGEPAEVQASRPCSGCGPPFAHNFDLHLPANMSPGVKTFAVWATGFGGMEHLADTTASIEIAAK
jgi:hypothetical protein